jgi:hypothetical protein
MYIKVKAKCPKCETIHVIKVKPPIEKFMPRLYCDNCKYFRSGEEEGMGYTKLKGARK